MTPSHHLPPLSTPTAADAAATTAPFHDSDFERPPASLTSGSAQQPTSSQLRIRSSPTRDRPAEPHIQPSSTHPRTVRALLLVADGVRPSREPRSVRRLQRRASRHTQLSSTEKQRKHRLMDSVRRQDELQLIEQIEALTSTAGIGDIQPPPTAVTARRKTAVLHAALSSLHGLSDTLTRLQRVVVEQEAQLRTLSGDTGGADPRNDSHSGLSAEVAASPHAANGGSGVVWGNRSITALVQSQALLSACFDQASVGLLLIDALTGCCIDANLQYLSNSGWTRTQILGRVLVAPYHVCMSYERGAFRAPGDDLTQRPSEVAERPLVRMTWPAEGTEGGEVRWVVADGVDQYPKSVQMAKELYSGQREAMEGVWRCRWADGYVHEQLQVSWVSERSWSVNAEEEKRMVPKRVVFASGFSDVMKVEDLPRNY